jgi:polyhydroxyalkanoate synthesis regulator phasin
LRRMALFGSGVAELTRHGAERIVRDWVKTGDVRREQASSLVKDLLDRSREARAELRSFVQSEIRNQIAALGVASSREIERLERRVARLEDRVREPTGPSTKAAGSPRRTAAKSGGKKTAAKKTATRGRGGANRH